MDGVVDDEDVTTTVVDGKVGLTGAAPPVSPLGEVATVDVPTDPADEC